MKKRIPNIVIEFYILQSIFTFITSFEPSDHPLRFIIILLQNIIIRENWGSETVGTLLKVSEVAELGLLPGKLQSHLFFQLGYANSLSKEDACNDGHKKLLLRSSTSIHSLSLNWSTWEHTLSYSARQV